MSQKYPYRLQGGRVSIYRELNNGYARFAVTYYWHNARKREFFTDPDEAKTHAQLIDTKLQNGEMAVLTLSDKDRLEYVEALELLRPHGKRLSVAIAEYIEALTTLGNGSLAEAARFFKKHHSENFISKTVAEVVTEFYEGKTRDGASKDYLKDIKNRLTPFAEAMRMPISAVETPVIDEWLRNLEVAGKTRNNFRNLIITLFNYARKQGYLLKDKPTAPQSTAEASEAQGEIRIFTPDQMLMLLKSADADLVPFLAIGGFAGIRHAEMQRLTWADIHWDEHFILISGRNAKTKTTRHVEIQANLAQWLQPYRGSSGKICKFIRIQRTCQRCSFVKQQFSF